MLKNLIDEVILNLGNQNIVIFFDEIDAVLRLTFETDDFFSLIRSCYNQRVDDPRYKRLTFCLLGVASPTDLIEDNRCSPFNIGTAINLSGFKLQEAKHSLLYGLKEKVTNPEQTLAEIIAWTEGQPFLTQKICHLVVSNIKQNTDTVDGIVEKNIIQDWESKDNPPHLRAVIVRIFNRNKRTIAILERYKAIINKRGDKVRNDAYEVELLLSGLILKENNKLKVSNRIYQEIFNLEWVEYKLEEVWQLLQESGQPEDVTIISPELKEVTNIIWICIAIIIISFLSLWAAYRWFTSWVWLQAFSQNFPGEIIELVRTLILALGAFYFIGIVWRKEAYELFRSKQIIVRRWRRTFLFVGVIVFILSIYYHLQLAPSSLQKEYAVSTNIFRTCFIPYIVYLPYTLINYNVLALSWVAVSSYSAFKDLSKSSFRTNYLIEKLSSLEGINTASEYNNNSIE